MNRIALTSNLYLDEYIPRDLYLKYQKTPWILQGLLDRSLVMADQKLRQYFGPVTINNWYLDGPRQWSGLRTPESPEYSSTSQHTYGRASDKIFAHAQAEEVRTYIKKNWQTLGITRIEDSVLWVHSDVAYTDSQVLVIVKP